MPLIKANGRIMQDGTKMIQYTDTVGPSYVTYTLENEQESVVISNKGVKPIVFSVGTTTITINPGENQRLEINFTSFQVKSVAGIQQFEVLMDEVGSTLPGGSDPLLSQKVNDITSQLAQSAKQTKNLYSSIMGIALDGKESINVNILGDSTGNEPNEWVSLLGQKLAANTAGYNVNYYLYNNANNKYDNPITIKTVGEKRKLVSNTKAKYAHSMDSNLVPVDPALHDVDLRIKVKTGEWTNGASRTLFAKDGAVDGKRCWRITMNASNYFAFAFTADGTTATLDSMAYVGGADTLPLNEEVYLRFVFDADNGNGGRSFSVYRSTDNGVTWTQLGSTVTKAGTATLFKNHDVDYQVLSYADTVSMLGEVYSVEIMDSIGGVNIAPRSIEAFARIADASTQSLEGTPEINIWNGSIPGYGLENFLANGLARKMIVNNVSPIIFLSSSHNEAFAVNHRYAEMLDNLLVLMKQYSFYPLICLLTQNPEGSGYIRYKQHAQRRRELIQYAKNNGYMHIDVYQAFLDYVKSGGNFYDLVKEDNVHPTPQGSELWKETVWNNIGF